MFIECSTDNKIHTIFNLVIGTVVATVFCYPIIINLGNPRYQITMAALGITTFLLVWIGTIFYVFDPDGD